MPRTLGGNAAPAQAAKHAEEGCRGQREDGDAILSCDLK